MSASLPLFRQSVRPEWIDYNGHMSEAFYVLVFGHATDEMMDGVGLGPEYRESTGRSLYTVEAHVRYLREVKEGASLTLRTRVLGVDTKNEHAKKLRFAHEMYEGGQGRDGGDGGDEKDSAAETGTDGLELVATSELFALHVGADGSVPFPAEVHERLAALVEEPPAWAGRAIGPVPRPA